MLSSITALQIFNRKGVDILLLVPIIFFETILIVKERPHWAVLFLNLPALLFARARSARAFAWTTPIPRPALSPIRVHRWALAEWPVLGALEDAYDFGAVFLPGSS